ncbi:MAG: exopolysaccharide biosynthesis protein [Chthoniobacterales bacterium]|jgi:hypothetical protein
MNPRQKVVHLVPPKRLSVELLELSESVHDADITLGDLVDQLEGRVYTMLLVLLSLPFCQPVLLPGLSTPFGVVIALLGLRFSMRQRPWLPRRLLATKLTAKFLPAVMRGSAKLLGAMEKLLHPRLVWLFEYRLTQFLTGVAICVCGLLLLLPLPIPLSNMFPALTVVLAAAAFSERDGYCLIASGLLFILTLLFFAALAWGGAEALHWVGHSV